MNRYIELSLLEFKMSIYDFFYKLKTIIYNKRIKTFWCKLWIRRDELHYTLYIDEEAMSVMNKEEKIEYLENLYKRRKIAHNRS